MKREARGRLRRIPDPLVAGLERGLNPEETEVLTDMSKWTRVRVRMEHEEIREILSRIISSNMRFLV